MNYNIDLYKEYVPFQTGEYYARPLRCEYCGANMNANCHAHARWCPYYCGNQIHDTSIGSESILFGFAIMYVFLKRILNGKR